MRHITRYLNPMADLEILVNELRHPALSVPLDRPDPFARLRAVVVGDPPLSAVSSHQDQGRGAPRRDGLYRLDSILELVGSPVAAVAPFTVSTLTVGALSGALSVGLLLAGWLWTERDFRFRPRLVITALRRRRSGKQDCGSS
jgi:hypothetical protein